MPPSYDALSSQLQIKISHTLNGYAHAEGDAFCVISLCIQQFIDCGFIMCSQIKRMHTEAPR